MSRFLLAAAATLVAGAAEAAPQLGAATLPNARSGAVGDVLTVFAVMANSGDEAGTGCAPALAAPFNGAFGYRAVAPDNATFTAAQNAPVDIAAGATQNFVLAFTPSAPMTEREIDILFDCANSDPAAVLPGVNTVLISAGAASPDILPILVTLSGDGVVRVGQDGARQAAAIAAANIGVGAIASVVASVDMGDRLADPLSLGICETDAGGMCVDANGDPAPTPAPAGQTQVIATLESDAVSTFSVFVYDDRAAGVRFNPDLSRVHVRFHDYAPDIAEGRELGSIALAPRPAEAGVERASASAAATAPGRAFTPTDLLPEGVFEAVFEADGARGEGVILAGPDGAIAAAFSLAQLAPPFAETRYAFFGLAAPASPQDRVRALDGVLHDLGGETGPAPYDLRGSWSPEQHVEGALIPGDDGPRILVRGQYDTLVSRDVSTAGLAGEHQVLADGRPLGFADFDAGAFSGLINDGAGGLAANCDLAGAFTPGGAAGGANLFDVTATLSTLAGEALCEAEGVVSGLGFQHDAPGDARGAIEHDRLAAFVETSDSEGAAVFGFRPVRRDGFTVRRVAMGFDGALFLTGFMDGTGRVLVVRQGGLVHLLDPETGEAAGTPFLDVTAEVTTAGERGLLGLALAPDFAQSGLFFVNLTNLSGDTEIRRYGVMAGGPTQADPASAALILRVDQPAGNHNGGWLDFGPDGHLYIALGDGGGSGDPNGNGQNSDTLLGAILRIDVSGDDFPGDPERNYAIPAGNPFAAGGGAPEIWAWGLRNPFRNSFDPATGALIIADVGQGAIEEINVMGPRDGGANFGWNRREGSLPFNGGADDASFTPPAAEYGHGSGPRQGRAVTGGYVYRGPIAALNGQYVFGDYVTGNIWSLAAADLEPGRTIPSSAFILRNADFTPDAGAIGNISSFGTDAAGSLYIVDHDGEIFRVEAP